MHPLMKRFLDLPNAVSSLEKNDGEQTVDAEETAYLAAAAALPQAKKIILKAKGKKQASSEVQQHLIVLATRAAALRVTGDPVLGPRVATATAALVEQGASKEEAGDLVAQCVLEEAFGYADDVDHFDADYLAETFDSLTHLARVDQDLVDDLLETFGRSGDAEARAMNVKVAELLLEAAWSEGPQPITPEHVDETLELVADTVAESDFTKALETLQRLLRFLATKNIVGPQRLERLTHLVSTATLAGADVDAEVEEEEDDEPDAEA